MLAVAGCGGSSGGDGNASSSSTTASVSKAEFIKDGDLACAKAGKKSETEFASFVREKAIAEGQEPSEAQFAEVGETILIPALEEQRDAFRATGTPKEGAAEAEALIDAVDKAIGKLEANPALAKSPPTLLAEAGKIARKYGFKVCGNR